MTDAPAETEQEEETPPTLAPLPRLGLLLACWATIFAATPGVVRPEGLGVLGLVALAPWALAAARPGRFAFAVEWLAHGIGACLLSIWLVKVWWGTLGFAALAGGLYPALAGVLLRLLVPRVPLVLAAPAAWVAFEILRARIEPPFAYGWQVLGHLAHDLPWLVGSARVWGVEGLSWALAATGAFWAELARRDRGERATALPLALVAGLGPLGLGWLAAARTEPPATRPGPRVMLVQPSVEQARKQSAGRPADLFDEACALTERGLARARAAGEPPPDLVCWGETMLYARVMAPGLEEAWDAGARPDPWAEGVVSRADVPGWRRIEREWVADRLLGARGRPGILPEGTWFLAGAEYSEALDGRVRRRNSALLWRPDGTLAGAAGKVHLVPGAESLLGLARVRWIREATRAVAGYVPDLAAYERTEVLELGSESGERWAFGATVCFDNAFVDPYTEPLRRAEVDFHLVLSNEAWYERSFEADQMLAFSRVLAAATGRAVVRATNSGVSALVGPDGRLSERLVVGGEDRMVAGTLRATVPVPVPGPDGTAPRTPYVLYERAWLAAWLALPVLLGLFGLAAAALRRRRRAAETPPSEAGR